MEKYKKIILNNIIPLKLSFIYWISVNSLNIHKLFFKYNVINLNILFIKILHMVFLYVLFSLIYNAIKNRHDTTFKHAIIITSIIFFLLLIGLLLVWPGTWSWDDVFVLNAAQNYHIEAWQNLLTSIYYIMLLETLPFSTGIILIQIFIISMIIGYCISKITTILFHSEKKRWKIEFLLSLTFFLPPLILYSYSGFRMGIYSYIELLLIVIFYSFFKEKGKLTLCNLSWCIFLTILVASWRSEGIYYILFFPIFLMISNKKITYKIIIVSSLIIILSTLAINEANTKLIGNNNYSITSTILSLPCLVKSSDPTKDQEELTLLSEAINLQVIYDNPKSTGEDLYWNYNLIKSNYSSTQYKSYIKGYIKLIIKYPQVFFSELFHNLYSSSGLGIDKYGYSTQRDLAKSAIALFDGRQGEVWDGMDSLFSSPFSLSTRVSTLRWLGSINSKGQVTAGYKIIWNPLIPTLFILFIIIFLFINKQLKVCLLLFCVLIRFIIIFLTSPAPYFMYYLSIYLIGYFSFFLFLIFKLSHFRRTQNENIIIYPHV